jgi:thioredoxin 1
VSVVNETLAHPRETSLKRLSRDKIQTVTSGTFTRLVLQAEGPIAVEFMSYGCAHCRAIEPVLEQVAEMVKAEEKIFRVNIAVEQELAGSYQIQGTPTLVMFLNQNEVGRVEGPSPTVSSVLTAVTQPFQS